MNARLVYIVNGIEIELEKADLETLDQMTYEAFNSEDDIINSSRYAEKLRGLPKNGEVRVAFNGMDVPLQVVDSFAGFGFDPFQKGSQYLSVLVGDRKIGPAMHSIRENIARTLCDREVVEEFYNKFDDKFTLKEKMFYQAGMLYENNELVFEGIKRIINESTCIRDGYIVGRVLIDGLSKFDSVKNKDEKGRLVSPKVFMKK